MRKFSGIEAFLGKFSLNLGILTLLASFANNNETNSEDPAGGKNKE